MGRFTINFEPKIRFEPRFSDDIDKIEVPGYKEINVEKYRERLSFVSEKFKELKDKIEDVLRKIERCSTNSLREVTLSFVKEYLVTLGKNSIEGHDVPIVLSKEYYRKERDVLVNMLRTINKNLKILKDSYYSPTNPFLYLSLGRITRRVEERYREMLRHVLEYLLESVRWGMKMAEDPNNFVEIRVRVLMSEYFIPKPGLKHLPEMLWYIIKNIKEILQYS